MFSSLNQRPPWLRQRSRRGHRGFVLTELVIALGVIGILLALASRKLLESLDVQIDKSVADYQTVVASAGKRWLADHFAAVAASATATAPFVLPLATLKSDGYLPNGWRDTNPLGQTPCILALQPQSNRLQTLLVTEGGRVLPLLRIQRIALGIGGEGGYVDPDQPAPLTARGAIGTYAIDLAPYVGASCSGTPVAGGGLVSALFFDNTQIAAPFLYRNAVPGLPEANTLTTNLNLGGNNINNVGQVNANTVNANAVNVAGNVTGNCFVDRTNPAFLVCPASSSNVNQVTADSLTTRLVIDKDNPTFRLDPNGSSVLQDAFITNRANAVKVSSLLGNFIETAVSNAVGDGATLAKPACPDAGQPYIYLIPRNLKIGPDAIANHDATDQGSSWRVNIRDGSNAPINGATVIAKTGCYYP